MNAIPSRFVLLFALFGALCVPSLFAQTPASAEEEAAYTRVITERADRIVAGLGLDEGSQTTAVRDLVANQYRNLRAVHDARDARLATARTAGGDKARLDAELKTIHDAAQVELVGLHFAFISRLSAELTPEQVEGVKDGMTHGILPITYRVYGEYLPGFPEEHMLQIKAWLIEAREHAILTGSANEKHAWFGKYKGRINNYLSALGVDMKQAERDAAELRKAAPAK